MLLFSLDSCSVFIISKISSLFLYICFIIFLTLEAGILSQSISSFKRTSIQGRKRDANIENSIVDTAGKEKVGQIEKVALTYIYTQSCVK